MAWSGWKRLPPMAVDVGFAAAVTAFVVVTEVSERRHHEHVPTTGLWILAGLFPALAVRRRFPGTALALTVLVQVGLSVTGTAPGANVPAELIVPYSAGAYAGRRVRLAWAVLAGVTVVALAVPGWASAATRLGVLEAGAAAGLAWLVGSVVRGRRARAATVVERAAHLEREREALTRQAVADERLRIARELHDVVAHDLSVVVVHAQAVQSVLDRDPAQARALVAGIEETGREALVEMRHLLGVLRDTHPDDRTAAAAADGAPAAGAPVPGPPVPQPGLDRLPALIDQVNAAGVPVTLRVSGPPERVPAAVQLSAYRIVQEALTNVLKHAGVATATVDVDQEGDVLHLTVTDAGRGAAAGLGVVPAGPGHGLVGMKERVGMFGGRLSAGPRPGGGFQVQAWIPLAEAAS